MAKTKTRFWICCKTKRSPFACGQRGIFWLKIRNDGGFVIGVTERSNSAEHVCAVSNDKLRGRGLRRVASIAGSAGPSGFGLGRWIPCRRGETVRKTAIGRHLTLRRRHASGHIIGVVAGVCTIRFHAGATADSAGLSGKLPVTRMVRLPPLIVVTEIPSSLVSLLFHGNMNNVLRVFISFVTIIKGRSAMKNNHRKEWESILSGGCSGAGNRDRTGTRWPSRDFKSRASANSATPAQAHGRETPVRIFIIARS